jgi:hypothetical protein
MPWARSALPALGYFYGCTFLVLALNVIPAVSGTYHLIHIIYSAALVTCLLPLFLFLIRPRERLPFVEIICLLYALQYTAFPFSGLSPDSLFESLAYKDLVYPATLTFFGVLALVIGYYLRPVDLLLGVIPPPKFEWEPRSAKFIAVLFMIAGFVGLALIKTGRSFPGGGQIIVFISNFGLVGILTLFLLQLRGQLGLWSALGLWLGYIPLYTALAISGGNSGPIAIYVLALGLIYIGERRRIPWLALLVSLLLLFPFMYAKYQYRDMVWQNGTAEFATVDDALKHVQTFADLAAQTTTFHGGKLAFALHVIFIRFDISYIFAYVTKLTPSQVPFLDGQSYADVLWKVIPRLLLPDKPDPGYGQIFGHMYYILSPDDLTTSINFPQLVEMYVNFGATGVIVGMFLLAQVYRILTYFVNRQGQGDWIAVFAASIFANECRIESNFSLVVAGALYHVILLLVVGFFIRALPRHRRAVLNR